MTGVVVVNETIFGKLSIRTLELERGQILLEFVDYMGYLIPCMSAKLRFYEKRVEEGGSIIEMKIWEVPKSEGNPDGVRYSLYWVKGEKVLVGYDNHHPKGHHRHYGEKQEPYGFNTIEDLIRDFLEDQRRISHESKKNQN